MRHARLAVYSAACAALFASHQSFAEPANPAHALAAKFAADSEPKSAAKPTATPAKPTQPPRVAAPAKTADNYEKEMLDAARAEAEARRKVDAAAAAPHKPVAAAQPAPGDAAPPATAPAADPKPAAAPSAPAAAKPPVQIKIQADIKAPAATPAAPAPVRDAKAPVAAVLVVLIPEAGGSNAFPKTPDPILCIADNCYISAGAGKEARLVTRADALGPKNTITGGAGACAGQTHCTFRGVAIPEGAELQIIDLGLVRHAKREAFAARIDTSCALQEGDLVCDRPMTAPDHRVWIVPELLAKEAGPERLEAALDDGLPEENVALDGDK